MPATKCQKPNCQLCGHLQVTAKWKSSDYRVVMPIKRALNCKSTKVFFIALCKTCGYRTISYTIKSIEERYADCLKMTAEDLKNSPDDIISHMHDCISESMFFFPIFPINPKNKSLNIKITNVLRAILNADWNRFGKIIKENRSFKILPPERYKMNYVPFTIQFGNMTMEVRECFGTPPKNGQPGSVSVLTHRETFFTSFSLNDPQSMEDELYDLKHKTNQLQRKLQTLQYKLTITNKRLERAGRSMLIEEQDLKGTEQNATTLNVDAESERATNTVQDPQSSCSWYLMQNTTNEEINAESTIVPKQKKEKKTVSFNDITVICELPARADSEMPMRIKRKIENTSDNIIEKQPRYN